VKAHIRNSGGQKGRSHRNDNVAMPASSPVSPVKAGLESEPIQPFIIAGVGASAGGLEAFTTLVESLPDHVNMALVFIQHLDPSHSSILADILARKTKIPVVEARDRTKVVPNRIYVIPPNRYLTILRGVLHLALRPAKSFTPIDNFLVSLAEDQKDLAVGVVLSGTAHDGVRGLQAIKEQGGITIVQDSSAAYSDLPTSAINAGNVDLVLAPKDIARELVSIGLSSLDRRRTRDDTELEYSGRESGVLDHILETLKGLTGVDFRLYKKPTVTRRLSKRMTTLRIDKLEDYASFLQNNPSEAEALFQEILISATGFFREPETLQALESIVYPRLLKNRAERDPIRIWVPACSTGEEPFSIAISIEEFLNRHRAQFPVQIFSTDVNEKLVVKARQGVYQDMSGVSRERLKRFFTKANGSYQLSKTIRSNVIFSKHNVLSEPPFSRIDLLICRNLLIYLGQELQEKVLRAFHYSLKPQGYLVLANAENVRGLAHLFRPVNEKSRIYVKMDTPVPAPRLVFPGRDVSDAQAAGQTGSGSTPLGFVDKEVDRVLLTAYSPSSVVVDSNENVISFRGRTGLFLEHPQGKSSLNVSSLAKEGLMVPLRQIIQDARRANMNVRKEGVRVKTDGEYTNVNIEAIPLRAEGHVLITFEEGGSAFTTTKGDRSKSGTISETENTENQLLQVGEELVLSRKHLQAIIDDKEAAIGQLQVANEELQSTNEELQTTSEEMETAKEELQATNEELNTMNEELRSRSAELNLTNDDLTNLLSNINLPVIMISKDLRLRRVNPQAEKKFSITPDYLDKPITRIDLGMRIPSFAELLSQVMTGMSSRDIEIQDDNGNWNIVSMSPYKTSHGEIDGVIIALYDVTGIKTSEEDQRARSSRFEKLATEQAGQLSEQARMSAIGQATSVIGHDLRNPLQTISNAVHLTLEKLVQRTASPKSENQEIKRHLETIRDQTVYMNKIVSDVQDYARPLRPTFTSVDVFRLVKDEVASLPKQQNIDVSLSFDRDRAKAESDPHMMRRIFSNILTNALEAMPKGGKLLIEGSTGEATVKVRVTDTGQGMSPETINKIFSPFFTTKAKGTGLGLSVAKRLSEVLNGKISVKSKPGKGTTFTIEIPFGRRLDQT
jgi:two-component system CheB/CheR fusion protein